jgi:tetratricopeptide (TPR) repeat protein
LAGAAMAQNKPEAALVAVDAGLQQVPDDFGLRLTRASVFEGLKRYDEAISLYEKLLAERPNAPIVANNLASLLTDHRTDDKSLKRAYELAQRFRGTDVPYFKDTLAWASHRVGKVKEAGDLLKTVAEEVPDLAAVHYHRGMNQLAQNDKEAARKSLQKAIELAKDAPFPQSDDARQTLQGL